MICFDWMMSYVFYSVTWTMIEVLIDRFSNVRLLDLLGWNMKWSWMC